MPEQLRQLLNRIKEWWEHFTSRQRTIIISMAVLVVVLFAVIVYFVSRPQYVRLMSCNTTKESASIVDILTASNIEYQISSDALRIDVQNKDLAAAELALATGGFKADTMTLDDVFTGSMSATSSEYAKRYQLFMENKATLMLESISGINSATCSFHIPEQTGTLIAHQQESSAYIQLDTDGSITAANAANIAQAIKAILGNETTANITILDSNGEMLFVGGDDYSTAGVASSMQELQNQAESYIANKVKKVLFGSSQYNNIEVTSFLNMDYSNYEDTVKEYYANDDRDEGMKAHEETYESESTGGVSGVPGTDANGENGPTYVTQDYSNSSTSSSEKLTDFLPNEHSRYEISPAGAINYETSSVAIAAVTFNEIHEEDAKMQGLLDGITWAEYKLANRSDTKVEVDEDFYALVSTATGIPVQNISIVAYESPLFYDKEGVQISWTTVLSIVLLLLILGLLALVVMRSMRKEEEEEQPEEISVEELLQSGPENAVEDIDVETKSETRLMIEKFVDDNPEAAAILLRNWLTDEW